MTSSSDSTSSYPPTTTTTAPLSLDISKETNEVGDLQDYLRNEPFYLGTKLNVDKTAILIYSTSDTPTSIASKHCGDIFQISTNHGTHYHRMCRASGFPIDCTLDSFCDSFATIKGNGMQVSSLYDYLDSKDRESPVRIYKTVDGTVTNLYFCTIDSKWKTSTSKKIDAKESFWTSEYSFDTLFRSTMASFSDNGEFDNPTYNLGELNTSLTYTFVLCHPESRQIISVSRPSITFISAQSTGKTKSLPSKEIANAFKARGVCVQSPVSVEYIKRKMTDSARSLGGSNINGGNSLTERGFIVHVPDSWSTTVYKFKFDYPLFKKVEEARGDNNNIFVRYTDLYLKQFSIGPEERQASKDQIVSAEYLYLLKTHFPEFAWTFSIIEYKFHQLCRELQNYYFQVYVSRRYILSNDVPEKYIQTLRQLHAVYLNTSQKTTKESVAYHLTSKVNGFVLFTRLFTWDC